MKILLIGAIVAVFFFSVSASAQGCGGWMTPQYATYLSYTLGPATGGKVTMYTRTSVDGSTSGICPVGCGCGPEHIGQAKTKVTQHSNGVLLGSNYTNGGYVPWNSYIGVSNTLNVVGVPGVVYDYAGTGVVICTAAGTLFNNTQTTPIDADIPGYMLIVSDGTFGPDTNHPDYWRQLIYEFHFLSGALATSRTLGESYTYSQSVPACTAKVVPATNTCVQNPTSTNTYGKSATPDNWALGWVMPSHTAPSPPGCGASGIVDHWQDCSQLFVVGAATYGTETGYVHTDTIDINNHITPPQSNSMPPGTKIVP